jgi:hypothetical protein
MPIHIEVTGDKDRLRLGDPAAVDERLDDAKLPQTRLLPLRAVAGLRV